MRAGGARARSESGQRALGLRQPGFLLPPLARRHEIDLPPAAPRAHKPSVPLEDARLGAVAAGELGWIRLDPVLAAPAPYDEADAGRGGAAQRHRRAGLGFHPRRRRPRKNRGGAYTFAGGKGSRTGSGRSLLRIARRVRMRGENGNLSLSTMS
jgi:hypothetical protein